MNKTGLMLRDAAYTASLLQHLPLVTDEEERKRSERIVLRIFHRNRLLFTNVLVTIFSELEDAGISISDKRAVDLMQARIYNLIRQSCGIADQNNKTITTKKEKAK